jgi:hypothetical protein
MSGRYDYVVDQGETWTRNVVFSHAGTVINNTGGTASMTVRPGVEQSGTLVALSSPSSGITLGGSNGTIALALSAAQTEDFPPKLYHYDLELQTSAGTIYKILKGTFLVRGETTR